MTDTTWRDLFPNGRTIFYEGHNPEAFAKEIKQRFGFDVTESDGWNEERGYSFFCPAEYLDEIYPSDKYPMGS